MKKALNAGLGSGMRLRYRLLSAFLGLAATISSVLIYHQVGKIRAILQEDRYQVAFGEPKPRVVRTRPEYYKADRRHVQVSSLEIPIYDSGVRGSRRSLAVEFIFVTSNRYLKKYLKDNEYEVLDYMLTSLEPMMASFVLTEEGKDTLKWKIMDELNDYIQARKIEGEIEWVGINKIIAS